VDFDLIGQVLIIYSEFVRFLRKNGDKMGQRLNYLQTSRKPKSEEKCHNIKTGNKSFECVEQFKYMGTTLANKFPFMKKLRPH
jgi:hypothetical protein